MRPEHVPYTTRISAERAAERPELGTGNYSGSVADEPDPQEIVEIARQQLAAARDSGRVSAIALSHAQLGMALASAGEPDAAIIEYRAVLDYLSAAQEDQDYEAQRLLRMTSALSGPADIDLNRLDCLVRINLAELFIEAGRWEEARKELDISESRLRGLGKRTLRRQIRNLRQRMDLPTTAGAAASAGTKGTPSERVAGADELLAKGRPVDAIRIALRVVEDSSEEDRHVRGQARQLVGMALEAMEQPEDAVPVFTEAWQDYLGAGDGKAAAHVAVHTAWLHTNASRSQDAVQMLEHTLNAAPQLDSDDKAQLLIEMASRQDHLGDSKAALRSFGHAEGLAQDARLRADVTHGMAVTMATGRSEADLDARIEALTLFDQARDAYEELGDQMAAAGCEHEVAALLGRLRSREPAIQRYERALARYEAIGPDDREPDAWADEVADVRENLAGLLNGATESPLLFRSGGHLMHHPRTP